MTNVRTGAATAIRQLLANAEDSLTSREVSRQLDAAGVTCANVRKVLHRRTVAGEFISAEIKGQLAYTLNPEFVPIGENRRGGRPKKTKAGPVPTPKGLIEAATGLMHEHDALHGECACDGNPECHACRLRAALAQQAAALAQAPQAAAPAVSAAPALPAKKPLPLALGHRLDAIANDLEDAICDACDAHLGRDLIKQLVLASGATHRAVQKLSA